MPSPIFCQFIGMHVFRDFGGYLVRSWITYNFGEPVLSLVAQSNILSVYMYACFDKDFGEYLARSWITYSFREPVLALVGLVQYFVSL